MGTPIWRPRAAFWPYLLLGADWECPPFSCSLDIWQTILNSSLGARTVDNVPTSGRTRREVQDIELTFSNVSDVMIVDVMIVMYQTEIDLNNSQSFDEILATGISAASTMVLNQTTVTMEPISPIKPAPLKSGIILGAVLTGVGGLIWLGTCFIIIRQSPKKKTFMWRVKTCVLLALNIPSFWMEETVYMAVSR